MDVVKRASGACGSAELFLLQRLPDLETTPPTRPVRGFNAQSLRLIVVQFLFAAIVPIALVSAQQNPAHDGSVRPCKILNQGDVPGKQSTKQKKNDKGHAEANSSTTCVEVHSASLDVQERLQAFVREQKWHVGDEEIGETFLSFSMALSKEELLGYTKPNSATERVQWRSGKAVVLVNTSDLNDGYARTMVSIHFEGFGESDDTFAMKKASWTLRTNGRLETILIGALQAHFRADR
jgi:hypothetical protein